MSNSRVKKALTLSKDTIDKVQKIADESFSGNFSQAVESLLIDALNGSRKANQESNLNRYVILKMFFYLRENFRARDDDLLERMDNRFVEICDEMKTMLIEEGMDYGPF
jgi:hypothetical protein